MITLLKQPLNKGLHVTVIRSIEDMPSEIHTESRLVNVGEAESRRVDFTSAEQILTLAKEKPGLLARSLFIV